MMSTVWCLWLQYNSWCSSFEPYSAIMPLNSGVWKMHCNMGI